MTTGKSQRIIDKGCRRLRRQMESLKPRKHQERKWKSKHVGQVSNALEQSEVWVHYGSVDERCRPYVYAVVRCDDGLALGMLGYGRPIDPSGRWVMLDAMLCLKQKWRAP